MTRRALICAARAGMALALAVAVAAWAAVLVAVPPTRATLARADATLAALDRDLAGAQAALAPFDVLSRPETLDAARTLTTLADTAQRTPLLALVFAPGTLEDGADLARSWEAALRDRPPLPALTDARREVSGWRATVRRAARLVTVLAVGGAALLTLLCAWVVAGQLALLRWLRSAPPG